MQGETVGQPGLDANLGCTVFTLQNVVSRGLLTSGSPGSICYANSQAPPYTSDSKPPRDRSRNLQLMNPPSFYYAYLGLRTAELMLKGMGFEVT